MSRIIFFPIWMLFNFSFMVFWSISCSSKSVNLSGQKKESVGSKNNERKSVTPLFNYISPFANHQRNSFINSKTSAKGKIAWSIDLGVTATKYWSTRIAFWEGSPLVLTTDDLILLDQTGKKLWSVPKRLRTPIGFHKEKLYYQGKNHFLQALNKDGTHSAKNLSFPGGLGSNDKVDLIFPREKDFVAVVFDNDQHDHQQGEEPLPIKPKLTIIKNRYEITYGDFTVDEFTSSRLTALYDSSRDILSLYTDSHFLRFDVEKEKLNRFPIPKSAVEWSMDDRENYYAIGSENNVNEFFSFDSKGKILWNWKQELKPGTNTETWRPHLPAIGNSGRVYALTNENILAFDGGIKTWNFSLKTNDDDLCFVTVLADNSILATSGKNLFFIDKVGKKIWDLTLDQPIFSAPVADEDGNIYVATEKQIVSVH